MRVSTAFKLLFGILAVVFVTLFFLQNRTPAHVMLPFEHSFRCGLIYLLLGAYLLGVISTMAAVVAISRKYKKAKKLQEQAEAEELLDD
jgi:uncharacterized integral membrane protein